jgi:hypothetical protein
MAGKHKLDIRNTIAIIFLIVLFIVSYSFWEYIKVIIRNILEFRLTYIALFAYTFIIFVLKFINGSNNYKTNNLIGTSFGNFFDTVINALTYGAAITSSLTLIKGFYIQKVFTDKTYFFEFSEVDVWLLFLTMCFLLYFSLSKVVELTKDLIVNKVEPNAD